MKISSQIFLSLIATFLCLSSSGQTLKWSENFEGGFLPAGWDNSEWSNVQWYGYTTAPCSGTRSARLTYHASPDSWLFTTEYTLQANYTYYIKLTGKRDQNMQI